MKYQETVGMLHVVWKYIRSSNLVLLKQMNAGEKLEEFQRRPVILTFYYKSL